MSTSTRSPRKSDRPPSAHDNRPFPKLQIPSSNQRRDDSTYYGVTTPTARAMIPAASQPIALAHRPRAFTAQTYPRPQSYHATPTTTGNYGPPLSMSAYYQPPPAVAPSYPPPSPSYMQYAAPGAQDYFSQQPPQQQRSLSSRFDPIQRVQGFDIPRTPSTFDGPPVGPLARYDPVNRTTSAFGSRDIQPRYEATYFDDGYASASEGMAATTIRTRERRGSIRVPSALSKIDQDYTAMPPPSRPLVRRAAATEYTINPLDVRTNYRDERDEYDEEPMPREHREHREHRPRTRVDYRDLERDDSRPRRPKAHRNSISYDLTSGVESVRLESANSGRPRRQTWYDQPAASTTSSGYEDKLNMAASYQEDVAGPSVPLTAEVLKRQQRRHAGSSRSTKSSASRDESDYKKSATTRTTRSGSGNGQDDENVTIKVTGQARVMVGGAQIDCGGGEIEIKRNQNRIQSGSERERSERGASSEYSRARIEDRKSRVNQPLTRTRMGSQTGRSYTRTSPQYSLDNYI